jgi:alkylation response protein AidB-like acyl-CoA dehydrogenase
MARDRRPDRAARTLQLALTRWSPASTGGSTNVSPLLSGTTAGLWRLSRVQSIFGGTTEIQKEIIARGLGL